MTELERSYAELAQEADSVILPPPVLLRDRGNRRTRLRLATGALVVAMVVGFGTAGVGWALRAGPSGSDPTAAATDIPDSAFLQRADLRSRGEGTSQDTPALPALCGARFSSDSLIDKRRTVRRDYRRPGISMDVPSLDSMIQTVTRYRPDGAARYLDEVREAVRACPVQQVDGREYRQRLVTGSTYGDESVMIEWAFLAMGPDEPLRDYMIGYIPVVRVGDAVTVLQDTTFEGIHRTPRSTMESLAALAAGYLEVLK